MEVFQSIFRSAFFHGPLTDVDVLKILEGKGTESFLLREFQDINGEFPTPSIYKRTISS